MILHLSPDAPWWLKDAAASALALHIGGGGLGLAFGAAAMTFRKGGELHRVAGRAFVAAMLTMSAVAAVVSPFLPSRPNIIGGVFTFYLVASAWATVRRKEAEVGRVEVVGMLIAFATASLSTWFGWIGAHSPHGMIDHLPYPPAFVLGATAVLAGVLDFRMILRGGVTGAARLARHLWRMCLGLFIASASFFLGQPKIFPASLRGSPLFVTLAILPLAMMVIWLIRVRLRSGPRAATIFPSLRTAR
jgi:uncharacterized membrane protein